MSEPSAGTRRPDGEEPVQQAQAGQARESGPEATLEALESPASFRLGIGELDERDERFSRPRKEQGPPLAEPDEAEPAPFAEGADETPETPVPEPPD